MRAIGLMSGTSLDGVDVALLDTDGETIAGFGPTGYRAYSEDERDLLRAALKEGAQLSDRTQRTPLLARAEALVTRAHAEAVERFIEANGLSRAEIGVVGFHGQTVLHRPALGLTVQIGDGEALRQRLGIPVVYDLRQADVAAGGQGAPLVPVFHRALAAAAALPRPLAVVNIGGVANVTLIGAGETLLAFDTGPGNALIDDWHAALRCRGAWLGRRQHGGRSLGLSRRPLACRPAHHVPRHHRRATAAHGRRTRQGLIRPQRCCCRLRRASRARL
jgi:anhydro-N-acetylmuramic acid kinase